MQEEFDIIVIGSGLSGLECGVMLSREGVGVCVVEQAAGPRRLPAVVPPPRPFHRHGDALRGQHAAGRHHAPLFRLFRHRGFCSKYGRSTKRSTSYRRAEPESSPTCTATTNSGDT